MPEVDLAGAPGEAGGRVPPNVLLNLALNYSAAAAAYSGVYAGEREYRGYFNARMCYSYPYLRSAGASVKEPDLNEASAYFSIMKRADARHACGGDSFSGNFMNWAGAATLDILRYALSGGDRVIDEKGLTVLQRAYLPDGLSNVDFYAHPQYFPRKVLAGGASIQVTPFDTPVLYIVSCRNRILFSNSSAGGTCDTPATALAEHGDTSTGAYLARVKVCDASDGPDRPDLCMPYGAAYKPVGSLQRHAGKMRVGLFSYLTEHGAADPNLYGGVLRAPLDYIGQSRMDGPDFIASANPQPLWNGATGVLASSAGGVLNYLNLLGRAAPTRRGVYKNADPLSEMYYEALRYLQGRQPSAGAASFSVDDGMPVFKAWSDPLLAACQRNLIVTIGNANTAGDRYVPGNTRGDYLDAARPVDTFVRQAPLNVMDWTGRVGKMEADAAYGNRAPRVGLRDLATQDTGQAGRGTYYVAGLAYWAHTNAIRADRPVRVDNAVLDLDWGGNGALADSNPRAIKPRNSQLYLTAKYGGFDDINRDGNPFRGADEGSDPAHYFLGGDPVALIGAVRAMLGAASAPPGRLPGMSALALPAPGADAFLFQADFAPAERSGGLSRFAVSIDGDGQLSIGKRLWEAGALLSASASQRHIYTVGGAGATIPFEWSKLTAMQRGLLDLAPRFGDSRAGAPDGLGEQRLNYLRGERGREIGQAGGIFRRRAGVLGEAIHSAPLYVGGAAAGMQGPGYAGYYERSKSRRPVVYLGANDGMLHAFDAVNGAELFAYVPNLLMGALNDLPATIAARRSYVDGAAGAGEALLPGGWKTILVSGMGGGAAGVFGLDVSDPERFQDGGALWEFGERDDAAMGHVSAPPVIAKFKTGLKAGRPEYRYFAVVASGYHHDAAGALFLLALDKPASAPWQAGVNYYKLALPAGDGAAALGSPALALGGDGAVRYAYVGDLQGNLWRIDFSGVPPWSDGVGRQPLFVARDDGGARQAITGQPKLVFASGGAYLVLFGTGKFIDDSDALPSSFQTQSFYAIRDAAPGKAVAGRGALAARTLNGAMDERSGFLIRGEPLGLIGVGAKQGWYFDFPHAKDSGERSVSSPVLAAGKVFFNTLAPGFDPCAAPAVRHYVVDTLSGFAVDTHGVASAGMASGGLLEGELPGSPLVYKIMGTDATGRAAPQEKYGVFNFDKAGATARGAVTIAAPARRMSWREVANWRELHEAATK
ncbi:type IV pilus assembly protein PilY1 [Oxalobacteraceae bacterium GrIS 1.11]